MNSKMKTLQILIALLLTTIISAQTITGKVSDNTEVIPFANVILKDSNQKIIAGTTTTDEGTFELKTTKGTYTLEVSFLGYQTYSKSILVDKNINLGTLILKEDAQNLDEIVVKTEKRVLERKIDRLVFNVENSNRSSQGDALELLKVTPGVRVQHNNIVMIGKSDLRVMINDKVVDLSDTDLSSFLSSIPSEDIKEIEVITPEYYVAAGRIDIRDSSKEGYDGWGEYAVPPMKQLSWNLLGDWLSDLETEEVVGYYRLIEMFEQQTRHKIEWVKNNE